MTELSISTERLVAQLMAPMNRLLHDVNQVLDSEILEEEYKKENTMTDSQTESEQGFGVEKISSMLQHKNYAEKTDLMSGPDRYEHATSIGAVSDSVQATDSLGKRNSVQESNSESPASPPAGVIKRDGIHAEMRKYDSPVLNEGGKAGNKFPLQKQAPQSTDTLNRQDPLHKQSQVTVPPQQRATGIPAYIVQPEVLPERVTTMPLPAGQTASQQGDKLSATASIPKSDSYREPAKKNDPESAALSNRILLRLRTKKVSRSVDDVASLTSSAASEDMLFDKTGGQVSTRMMAPRSIRRQSNSITQGLDPILQRAHQISNEAFPQEPLNDGTDMPPSRVQNTFNVNVSMSQDASSAGTSREILEDTLLEMLRTAARRQGLEV